MAAEKAFLVPVVVDATTEPEALVPTQFRDVQWTQMQAGEVPTAFVHRIAALISQPVARHMGSPERNVSRAPVRRLPIALLLLSGAAVVALVIATAMRGGWLSQKPVTKVEAGAEAFAWRGEKDRAFEWLERAYRQRDGGLGRVKIDPLLISLRRDPRFGALLRKMNLPE